MHRLQRRTDSRDSTSQVGWWLQGGKSLWSHTSLPLPHSPPQLEFGSRGHHPRTRHSPSYPSPEYTHHTEQCSRGACSHHQALLGPSLFLEVILLCCDTEHLPLQNLWSHTYSTTVTIFFFLIKYPDGLEERDDLQQTGHRSRHTVVPTAPATPLRVKLCLGSSWLPVTCSITAHAEGHEHLSDSPLHPISHVTTDHATSNTIKLRLTQNRSTAAQYTQACGCCCHHKPKVQKARAVQSHKSAGKHTASRLFLQLPVLHSAGNVYCVWHRKSENKHPGTWSLFSILLLKAKAKKGEGGGKAPFQQVCLGVSSMLQLDSSPCCVGSVHAKRLTCNSKRQHSAKLTHCMPYGTLHGVK